MEKKLFGKTADGREAFLYTIANGNGMSAVVTDFGAILVDLNVPFKDGNTRDVVLGYDNLEQYLDNNCFFGATIAPNANRIAGAGFTLEGKEYRLDPNEGPHNLHTHKTKGSHKRLWSASDITESSIKFTLNMEDCELGFPGNMMFSVKYSVTQDNGLKLEYYCTSDRTAIINPTNHAYFNLDGHDGGFITGHILKLKASRYTEVKEGSIPTGNMPLVEGTVFDFTKGRRIADNIDDDIEQLTIPGGYDHNFCIDDYNEGSLKEVAWVESPDSGMRMTVSTDLPGIQFYAGNSIPPHSGKRGASYNKRCALCLETDYYPDAIHHPEFPQPIYGPNRPFKSTTIYRFE